MGGVGFVQNHIQDVERQLLKLVPRPSSTIYVYVQKVVCRVPSLDVENRDSLWVARVALNGTRDVHLYGPSFAAHLPNEVRPTKTMKCKGMGCWLLSRRPQDLSMSEMRFLDSLWESARSGRMLSIVVGSYEEAEVRHDLAGWGSEELMQQHQDFVCADMPTTTGLLFQQKEQHTSCNLRQQLQKPLNCFAKSNYGTHCHVVLALGSDAVRERIVFQTLIEILRNTWVYFASLRVLVLVQRTATKYVTAQWIEVELVLAGGGKRCPRMGIPAVASENDRRAHLDFDKNPHFEDVPSRAKVLAETISPQG